jgi:hypothetical protein
LAWTGTVEISSSFLTKHKEGGGLEGLRREAIKEEKVATEGVPTSPLEVKTMRSTIGGKIKEPERSREILNCL